MRYRALSPTGDYTFGAGTANFYVNNSKAVAQSVLTRLRLWQGEWFLNVTVGTPWLQQILSAVQKNTKAIRDLAIQSRVLQTEGVTGIDNYFSSVDSEKRSMTVSMTISTIYGSEDIEVTL